MKGCFRRPLASRSLSFSGGQLCGDSKCRGKRHTLGKHTRLVLPLPEGRPVPAVSFGGASSRGREPPVWGLWWWTTTVRSCDRNTRKKSGSTRPLVLGSRSGMGHPAMYSASRPAHSAAAARPGSPRTRAQRALAAGVGARDPSPDFAPTAAVRALFTATEAIVGVPGAARDSKLWRARRGVDDALLFLGGCPTSTF